MCHCQVSVTVQDALLGVSLATASACLDAHCLDSRPAALQLLFDGPASVCQPFDAALAIPARRATPDAEEAAVFARAARNAA